MTGVTIDGQRVIVVMSESLSFASLVDCHRENTSSREKGSQRKLQALTFSDLPYECTECRRIPKRTNWASATDTSTPIQLATDGTRYLPASASAMYETRKAPIVRENATARPKLLRFVSSRGYRTDMIVPWMSIDKSPNATIGSFLMWPTAA